MDPVCPRHRPIYDRMTAGIEPTDEEWEELIAECPDCQARLLEELGYTEEEWVVREFEQEVGILQRLAIYGPWVAA